MFTEVIIFGLVLISIAALWVSASLKTIKTGTKGIYKVFEKPKGKPRGPGLVFVPYGIATIDPVDITRKSKNVPSFSFPVTFHKETSIDADDPNIDIEKVLMTNAHTPEISISIEPDLSQLSGESETDALLRFYSYIRNTSDDTVWENIRDRTEAAVTKHVRFMGIANAKLAGKNIFDKIRDEVKKDLKDEGVPVKIISFVVNTGIKGDKAVEDEISRAATSIMKQRADLQDTARELEVAKKKRELEQYKAQTTGIVFNDLMKAYNIDDANKGNFLLSQDAMKIWQQMATSQNKVFFVNNDMASNIMAMVNATYTPSTPKKP